MARFDVYRNSGGKVEEVPFLLDVQSDVLSALDTRVVVPLRRRDRFSAKTLPSNLMPAVIVDGLECVLEIPKLAAVPIRILKRPVTTLYDHQFEITAALDFLFQGF
ncbi:CcdB family protein [Methylomonas sp. LL1]|uniref:CcdB family protein n=1 Tax=Methylomonas sp. LL1 TaxID=2785785 RepID=UPI0018C3B6AB|nr:CcdB family protein [Methylomonas sp. LL1]QPK63464.1 CcdB family protein [Methylomonas sp. LL1]